MCSRVSRLGIDGLFAVSMKSSLKGDFWASHRASPPGWRRCAEGREPCGNTIRNRINLALCRLPYGRLTHLARRCPDNHW